MDRLRSARVSVAERWAANVAAAVLSDHRVPSRLPGYFVDRFAFAQCVWSDRPSPRIPDFDVDACVAQRDQVLRASLVPTECLNGWVPPLDVPAELGPFYPELLQRWQSFCGNVGLPAGLGALRNLAGHPWRELFDADVFYPRGAVLTGPNFLDAIDVSDRAAIVTEFGPSAPIDFFCVMHQIHDAMHHFQTGEPLLNEIVTAAAWVCFLDSERLWLFQRNSASGRSCVRELSVVRSCPRLLGMAIGSGLEILCGFERARQTSTYLLACRWAGAFDEGAVRYRQYLDGMRALLSIDRDTRWISRQDRALRRLMCRRRDARRRWRS